MVYGTVCRRLCLTLSPWSLMERFRLRLDILERLLAKLLELFWSHAFWDFRSSVTTGSDIRTASQVSQSVSHRKSVSQSQSQLGRPDYGPSNSMSQNHDWLKTHDRTNQCPVQSNWLRWTGQWSSLAIIGIIGQRQCNLYLISSRLSTQISLNWRHRSFVARCKDVNLPQDSRLGPWRSSGWSLPSCCCGWFCCMFWSR